MWTKSLGLITQDGREGSEAHEGGGGATAPGGGAGGPTAQAWKEEGKMLLLHMRGLSKLLLVPRVWTKSPGLSPVTWAIITVSRA